MICHLFKSRTSGLKMYCQHLKVQLCEDRNLKRNLRPSALSESGMGNPRGPTQLLLTQNCWQLCERWVFKSYFKWIFYLPEHVYKVSSRTNAHRCSSVGQLSTSQRTSPSKTFTYPLLELVFGLPLLLEPAQASGPRCLHGQPINALALAPDDAAAALRTTLTRLLYSTKARRKLDNITFSPEVKDTTGASPALQCWKSGSCSRRWARCHWGSRQGQKDQSCKLHSPTCQRLQPCEKHLNIIIKHTNVLSDSYTFF